MSLNLELIDLARNIEQKLEQSSHLHFASGLSLHRLVKMYGLTFSIFFLKMLYLVLDPGSCAYFEITLSQT